MGSPTDDDTTKHETQDTDDDDDDESEKVYELTPSEKKKLSQDPYIWTQELEQTIHDYFCEHRQQVSAVLDDWLATSIQFKDESNQSEEKMSSEQEGGKDPNWRYH